MGCDIHFVLEKRVKGNSSKWLGVYSTSAPSPARYIPDQEVNHDYGALLEQRSYRFFAALAGVRGEGPAPNGLPQDMSELTQANVSSWGYDAHSHGHCTAFEFLSTWDLSTNEGKLTAEAAKKRLAGSLHTARSALYALLGIYSDQFDDFRVVYFFDN